MLGNPINGTDPTGMLTNQYGGPNDQPVPYSIAGTTETVWDAGWVSTPAMPLLLVRFHDQRFVLVSPYGVTSDTAQVSIVLQIDNQRKEVAGQIDEDSDESRFGHVMYVAMEAVAVSEILEAGVIQMEAGATLIAAGVATSETGVGLAAGLGIGIPVFSAGAATTGYGISWGLSVFGMHVPGDPFVNLHP